MNIIVCIKQVPNVQDIRIHPETGNLIREGVPSIVNPDDKHAIEAALALNEKHSGEVTVITMGPRQAEEAIRETFAMGVEKGILLSDKAFGGADTLATSYALHKAIQKIGDYDLILCGRQAMDSSTAQVPPQIAELLGIPQLTYAKEIDINGSTVRIKRVIESGYEVVEAKMPALVTVMPQINEPRVASMNAIMAAYEKEIVVWKLSDIDADRDRVGLRGSPTRIRKAFTPQANKTGEILSGTPEEMVSQLVMKLLEKHII